MDFSGVLVILSGLFVVLDMVLWHAIAPYRNRGHLLLQIAVLILVVAVALGAGSHPLFH